MRLPSIEWHSGFDRDDGSLVRELFWLLRHGKFCTAWNRDGLIFGGGRTWYDGPIWFLHLGVWSCDLSVER